MLFLNLTFGQFFVLLAAVSAFSVALYLLDRARRRQVVATLRFWVEPGQPAPVTRRKRIQQPFSLLLQLLGMALLLLAIAQWQWGSGNNVRRDHVILLDTSAWMNARTGRNSGQTLMDLARSNALAWLRAVPQNDRVMLVRADALATPATAWETDHRKVSRAILESQPGSTVLGIGQSLQFARSAQRQSGSTPGEIVYAGPARIAAREANNLVLPALPALRVLPVDDAIENCGIRSVGASRVGSETSSWSAVVRVKNYGRTTRAVNVTLNFGNAPQGARALTLAPGEERESAFTVHASAAGLLETRLYPQDAFPADNYAPLELPKQRSLHVVVYSKRPELLRAVLSSDPRVRAEFRPPSQYAAADDGLVILDGFRPAAPPDGDVLWMDPPSTGTRVDHPAGLKWAAGSPLTAGMRSRDLLIDSVSILNIEPGDVRIAEVDNGVIALARVNGGRKTLITGFNPFDGAMRYQLAAPLLLANMLRWVAPGVFRDVDVNTQAAGTIATPISTSEAASLQVLNDSGEPLPFSIHDKSLQFFAGDASRVRVVSGANERVFSLTLPEMWDTRWQPPANARHGIPSWRETVRRNVDIWPVLAALGTALLLAEWIVYGRLSRSRLRVVGGNPVRSGA